MLKVRSVQTTGERTMRYNADSPFISGSIELALRISQIVEEGAAGLA